MAYSAPGVVPVDEFAPGTSILISGPPLTRKRDLMIRLLAGDDDEGAAMVTTKMGAGKLLELFREGAATDRPTASTSSTASRKHGGSGGFAKPRRRPISRRRGT